MAASIFHGKAGNAYFSTDGGASFTVFTHVVSWTCTLTAAVADTSAMGQTLKTGITGILSGTAAIECIYDSATFAQIDETDNVAAWSDGATGLEIELLRDLTDASLGYQGRAKVESVVIDTSEDDRPTITYNMRFVSTVVSTVSAGT